MSKQKGITLGPNWRELLREDEEMIRSLIRGVLQEVLEAEMTEALGAEKSERVNGRMGYRSGHYRRSLTTRVGNIELRVPQDRQGLFSTEVFERYQRSEKALMDSLVEMYIQGVATRKVKEVTETLCGHEFSSSSVSRVTARLDEDLSKFFERRLEEPYPYLVLDARYERVREEGVVRSRERGLHGVEYVVSDDHPGLRRSVPEVFPESVWQRCYVHFLRNALDHLPRKADGDCMTELRWLYDRRSLEEARRDLGGWLSKWQGRYPKLCVWVEENIEETFTFYRLPPPHHKHMKSTNMLERLNEEIKRRTHIVRIFPNEASCLRLVRALAVEKHEEWIEGTRYLNMDLWHEHRKTMRLAHPAA